MHQNGRRRAAGLLTFLSRQHSLLYPSSADPIGMCRMFQRVAELKQQYTDKYVVVDDTQPELARFKGITGQVKTVNMSGRALVQFDAWANIGWYDIDPEFLTVISEPLPKPEAKAESAGKESCPRRQREGFAGRQSGCSGRHQTGRDQTRRGKARG